MNIKIYDREKEDGLGDHISNNSIAYCSVARPIQLSQVEQEKQQFLLKSSAKANPDQVDLYYLDSVLASVGWNANDDVFDRLHTWAARTTPIDKQFNYEHDEKDIIGHITSSTVFSQDGKAIAENIAVEDLPSQFDVVVGSVLYKSWQDENLQVRMDQLIREIAEGKWFVSMECLFPDFDYAVVTPNGEQKVIARSNETSFLTKYLRVYGGTGEYQGHKVGRLLKNFVFSGKGLVSNPANKRSLILNSNSFQGTYASSNLLREKSMSAITQEQFDGLKAEKNALAEEIKTLRDAKVQAVAKEVEDVKVKLTESEKAAAKLQEEIVGYKGVIAVKDEEIAKLKTQATELETAKTALKTELDTIKAEKAKADRLAKLSAVVAEDRAVALVEKFASVSDEVFEELVATFATAPKPDPKEVADKTSLESAQISAKAGLGVNTNENVELQKAAASWMAKTVLSSTAKVQK